MVKLSGLRSEPRSIYYFFKLPYKCVNLLRSLFSIKLWYIYWFAKSSTGAKLMIIHADIQC